MVMGKFTPRIWLQQGVVVGGGVAVVEQAELKIFKV
tara:strand:- start:1675 stop:1782 length:108 start_codon:yes stop_codon:yes gene_type:complete